MVRDVLDRADSLTPCPHCASRDRSQPGDTHRRHRAVERRRGRRCRPRLDVAVRSLEERGYDVVLGECLGADGVVSAPKEQRAAELTAMLSDPAIRGGRAALGRRARDRPARPARLGRARRGRADLAGRLQRPDDADAAAHAAARLGHAARQQPDGHAVRAARRAAALDRRRLRRPAPFTQRSPGRYRATGLGRLRAPSPTSRRWTLESTGHLAGARRRGRRRHRAADRRLHRDASARSPATPYGDVRGVRPRSTPTTG